METVFCESLFPMPSPTPKYLPPKASTPPTALLESEAPSEILESMAPHLPRLHSIAAYHLGCHDRAWDAVQEALILLWRKGGGLQNPLPWMEKAVVFRAMHLRRSSVRRCNYESQMESRILSQLRKEDSPFLHVEQEEASHRIQSAIQALPAANRQVMKLRALHGLNYEEIADRLNLAVGTVRSRIHRARKALSMQLPAAPA